MPRRIEPDDEVRRFAAVWLGPPGYSLPWRARYAAYAVGAAIFMLILLVEAITPLAVGIPPVWEICITVLATSALMMAVDHDRPLSAAIRNVITVARAPRPQADTPVHRRPVLRRVKITRKPL
jgi:hypothetical protein